MESLTHSNDILSIEKIVQETLGEFRFGNYKSYFSTLSLTQLLNKKELPIKGTCQAFSLLIASKLQKLGIKNSICITKKKKGNRFIFHLINKVYIGGEIYYIDDIKSKLTLGIYKYFPKGLDFVYEKIYDGSDNFRDLFKNDTGILVCLYIKDAVDTMLPRQWPLNKNRRKNIERQKKLNEMFGRGGVIKDITP